MRIRSKLLSFVFVSATLPFMSAGAAQASDMCTVKTAKQSVSSTTLCACDVVSSRMVRYIQRRADFESILEQTLLDCPAFAAILTDLPTASVGFAEKRTGDGRDDETFGDDDGPDDNGDPDVETDPDPESEPPKSDPPKSEPPKSDPPKSDPPKSDPPKSDPPKSEPPK